MDEPYEPIGTLFPLGGPVPPDLIIGRRGEIDEIGDRLREGMSTMLAGARRIGKTTVCAAVCEQLGSEGTLVIEVDVPERGDSRALLQLIIDACSRISLARRGRSALRVARPMAAARYTARSALNTNSDTVTEFDVRMGIDEADRHLRDDGA
jgi:nucleoside-triphosphatase THEP1